MNKMAKILGIALIISLVLVSGCVTNNTQAPAGATVSTPIVTIVPTVAPTVTPDCQCVLPRTCKEINARLTTLESIRENCVYEMVKRQKAGNYNPLLNNPACDAYSSCTEHCNFVLRQHYDDVCLSGYQGSNEDASEILRQKNQK